LRPNPLDVPSWKTQAGFRQAESQCQTNGFIGVELQARCLKSKGYKQLTVAERELMERLKFIVPPGKTETDLRAAGWKCSETLGVVTEEGP
jgi:hypothetical protein